MTNFYDGTEYINEVTNVKVGQGVVYKGTALPVGAANYVPQYGFFCLVDSLSAPTTATWYIQTSATISSPSYTELGGAQDSELPYLKLSTTIGDYTSPSAAVATSSGTTSSTEYQDTTGTDAVVNMDTTNNRAGQKVTSITTQSKPIVSMTVRMKSASGATGTLVYRIRKTSDSSIVATSTQTLNAATIGTSAADYTLNFNNETLPAESYYAMVESISSGQIEIIGTLSSTTANGNTAYWNGAAWQDLARDTRMSIIYSETIPASNIYDGNTGTLWKSTSEASPAVYVDLSGSAREIVGVALNLDRTATTVTAIKIRASTDTSFDDTENIAYINVSDCTDDTWRFIANNFLGTNCRYVQVIGVGTGVLSINEIKVRYGVSDLNKILLHRHRTRSTSAADSFVDSN